jgi:N-acetylmuramoyl-L-alanine amidase
MIVLNFAIPTTMFVRRLTLAAAVLLLVSSAARSGATTEPTTDEPARTLSTLGQQPDWRELEPYQETITHDEFVHLLNDVYCTHGIGAGLIQVAPDEVRVLKAKGTCDYFTLHFARSKSERHPIDRTWTPPSALSKPPVDAKPLSGFQIALDPGHLGGRWARMEERWFQIKNAAPVTEGDLTLKVAQLLAPKLESLGAKVSLVRSKTEPLTPSRPPDFRALALELLHDAGVEKPREDFDGPADPEKERTVRWQEELLFYRNSEIRRRAKRVNDRLKPDLVLCLHFNAEAWGDPAAPTLVQENHLHLLVNGSYLPVELELDDQRFEMLHKLLSRAYPEELGLAESIAAAMAKATGLPPYHYKTDNVTPVGTSGYVYARNLMATRLYRCPTVYLEPYVMNSSEVFDRVQAGDYKGRRSVAGKNRASIFREYADAVAEGVLAYFKKVRP